jgi:general secretion pathway protein E
MNKLLSLTDFAHELLSQNVISQEDADSLLQKGTGSLLSSLHPLEVVANAGLSHATKNKALTLDELTQWLADWSELPIMHIDPLEVNVRDSANTMSFAFAQRHQILAINSTENEVFIATAQPFNRLWQKDLQHVLRKKIKLVVSNPLDIRRFTIEFYQLANSVNKAFGQSNDGSGTQNFEQLLELGKEANPDANDQHIVKIVDWLLQYAFDQRASDIHIEPRREISQVRFRIDGVLHHVYELPAQVGIAVVSRLKILGRLNVAEKRKPQDGRIKTRNPDEKEIELRLSTLPTAFGEKLVMRIFDPDVLVKSAKELGFSAEDSRRWQTMTNQPNGIILVTGPTGSGKTTTLYSSLKLLATPQVNVCTIEDPMEMVEPAFNQMQVQANIGVTFASGIRALMRQDPDIIMIGEIRDLETAEMAIQAALTGHLVLSTLHTNDAPSAITRLLELGIPSYLIRSTLLGVMAQRLVRTLCPHCKIPHSIDENDWQLLTAPWKATLPTKACQPVGCLECRDTGYKGRAGVYEILPLSASVKNLINENCDIDRLRTMGIKEGMHSLRLSGAHKVGAGLTTIEEVLRVTPTSMKP